MTDECSAPSMDEINGTVDNNYFEGLPENRPDGFFRRSWKRLLDTEDPKELRVWYHRAENKKSRFCPRQSEFEGPRANDSKHQGVDIFSPQNTQLVAHANGKLVSQTPKSGWGQNVYLYFRQNGENRILLYAHLSPYELSEPITVKKGEKLPIYSGCTGNAGNGVCDREHECTVGEDTFVPISDHVHYEVFRTDSAGKITERYDPIKVLNWAVKYVDDDRCNYDLEKVQIA